MHRRTFLQVLGQSGTAACLSSELWGATAATPGQPAGGVPPTPGVEVDASEWKRVSSLLDDASSSYSEPWDDATCRTLMKGGYLGNGDLGVHLGGTRHSLVYYLGKNGFHAGNDTVGLRSGDDPAPGPYRQHILNLARLTLESVEGTEAGDHYRVTQDLRHAEIRTECTMAGLPVRVRAFLAPETNAFVLELSTGGGMDLRVKATLSVVGNVSMALDAGVDGSMAWVTKEPNADGAPFYVKGAVVARVIGAPSEATRQTPEQSGLAFTLPANGRVVRLFVQADHTKNAPSPASRVRSIVRDVTPEDLDRIESENRTWWRRFWLRSHVRLGDEVQRYWYNHLYMIGSAARSGADNSPGKAPGHWGPWNRADDMKWFGNLGMNYNAQNPYYGTFAANHVDLVDPYIETIRHYAATTGRQRVVNRWVSPEIAARMPPNCRGVEFEGSFTSHGTPATGEGKVGAEDCCMATNAVFAILPMVWKWKYGRDTEFLRTMAYPLMREVADFYDDYIGKPVDGRYDVYGSVHEGADWFAKNDMFSLGAIRFLYREIIAASTHLECDADRRAHWQDILDHMADYPLQLWGDRVTFRPDGVHDVMEALHYNGGARNTGVMFTTTFDNIGKRSLPAYRLATCNTLDRGNMFHPQRWCGWQNGNDFGMMFVMAVRAGYRPDRVLDAIRAWKPEPNGVVSQKDGGGIETAGILEAINSMLLQSHDGVLRIFPNWDRSRDAEFKGLRAVGAFLVEARYRARERMVDRVRVVSERGNTCVVQNPFEEACIRVIRTDTRQRIAAEQDQEEFRFPTVPGVTYEVQPADCRPAVRGAPVIVSHPTAATVLLPEPATFSIAAKGRGLRYQWQKNRIDIPGATSTTYTTSATTLWDIGSEYRCVISNSEGSVRSRPGVLVPRPAPDGGVHPIVGTWSYSHAGRSYTREFTSDHRCILRDGGVVGWVKSYSVAGDRTVLVEGGLRHVLTGPDTLDIEKAFIGHRVAVP